MTLRYALLAAGAAGVVLMGVYLFVEVRAAPPPAPVVAEAPSPDRVASRPAPLPAARPVRPVTHAPPPPAPAAPSPAPQPVLHPTLAITAGRAPPADVKLVEVMDEANKAYDMQDYDQAIEIAQKVLAQQPGNIRMLRIMVSSSCIGGDPSVGQKYFEQLPRYDRDQMNTRCSRFGVTFKEPSQ